jgi:hypothetical protein
MGLPAALLMTSVAMQPARAAASFAPVPELLHYQARLTGAEGVSIDKEVHVQVYLYDDATLGMSGDLNDGHLLYAEDHGDVRVERGMLRVTIGGGAPLGPFAGAPLPMARLATAGALHVDIALDGEWLSPRQAVGFFPTAAYAQYAKTADALEGELHLIAANLPDALPASKVTGTLSPARIPALPSSTLSGMVSADRIPGAIPLSRITSGTLPDSVIPSIDASKITSGTFGAAQLPPTLLAEGAVGFMMGEASDGENIGLPPGFAESECAWIVGLANNDDHTWSGGIDHFRIYTGSDINSKTAGTNVHCEFQQNGWPAIPCDVAYLTVCKH